MNWLFNFVPVSRRRALQAATSRGKPVLFRVDYNAGHGIGSTMAQRHAAQADAWAFLLRQMGEKEFKP